MQKNARGGKPKDTSGHRVSGPRSKLPGRAPERIKQDFFPRSASANAQKTGGYLFNQAPINRNQVKEEAKERVNKAPPKRSAFVARLYNEDEPETGRNQEDDEMKVF